MSEFNYIDNEIKLTKEQQTYISKLRHSPFPKLTRDDLVKKLTELGFSERYIAMQVAKWEKQDKEHGQSPQ